MWEEEGCYIRTKGKAADKGLADSIPEPGTREGEPVPGLGAHRGEGRKQSVPEGVVPMRLTE